MCIRDRYLTDGAIVDAWDDRFTPWLAAVNKVVGARSIPVHVELRVDGDTIAPCLLYTSRCV